LTVVAVAGFATNFPTTDSFGALATTDFWAVFFCAFARTAFATLSPGRLAFDGVTSDADLLARFSALCVAIFSAFFVALLGIFLAGAGRTTFRVAAALPATFFTAVLFEAFLLAAFFAIFFSALFGDCIPVFFVAALLEPAFFAGAVRLEPPALIDFFSRLAPSVCALPFLRAFFAGFRATFFAITGS